MTWLGVGGGGMTLLLQPKQTQASGTRPVSELGSIKFTSGAGATLSQVSQYQQVTCHT
jgi:hypothetical protein